MVYDYFHLVRKQAGTQEGRCTKLLGQDGGGVRGLSALLILEHLMKGLNPEAPPKPCEVFDLIGGTPTRGCFDLIYYLGIGLICFVG